MSITIEDFIVAFGSDDIPQTPEGQPDQAKVDWSMSSKTVGADHHSDGQAASITSSSTTFLRTPKTPLAGT